MKYKINPFLISLIKKNFLIFILLILLILINFILIITNNFKLNEIKSKNLLLENEIDNYKKKFLIISNLTSDEEKLNKFVAMLNSLIPDEEDYFSIIYSLENLSIKTGFNIVGYTVNLNSSNPEKLKITISGTGNTKDFLNFLNEYNFAGGRLITSDNIELNNDANEIYKINLTFYNKKVFFTDDFQVNNVKEILFEKLEEIEKKVSFNIDFQNEKNTEYPIKKDKNLF